MKKYTDSGPYSCAYDALQAAGIPTEEWMKGGLRVYIIAAILEANGFTLYPPGNAKFEKSTPAFIVFGPREGSNIAHAEYHDHTNDIIFSNEKRDILLLAKKNDLVPLKTKVHSWIFRKFEKWTFDPKDA